MVKAGKKKVEKGVTGKSCELPSIDEAAEREVDWAFSRLLEYAKTKDAERDEERLRSDLDAVEDVLEEYSDRGWGGYWIATEAVSRLAKSLGVDWCSPYVHGDSAYIQVRKPDAEIIRRVSHHEWMGQDDVAHEMVELLKGKYAEALDDSKVGPKRSRRRS